MGSTDDHRTPTGAVGSHDSASRPYDEFASALSDVARAVDLAKASGPPLPNPGELGTGTVGDDALGLVRLGYVHSSWLLEGAASHLEGVARSLTPPSLAAAALTGSRAVVEAAVKAWWLLEVWPEPLRVAVRFGKLAIAEHKVMFGALRRLSPRVQIPGALEEDRRLQAVFQHASARGVREKPYQLTRELTRIEGPSGELYAITSATAHSVMAAVMRDVLLPPQESFRHVGAATFGAAGLFLTGLAALATAQGRPSAVAPALLRLYRAGVAADLLPGRPTESPTSPS